MSSNTSEQILDAATLPAQPISEEVLIEKYSKGEEKSIADVNLRVARALASVEAPDQQKAWEAKFLQAWQAGFLPAGRIQSAAGTDLAATLTAGHVKTLFAADRTLAPQLGLMPLSDTEKKARDIQIPVPSLVSLPEHALVAELERAVAEHGFSRYVITDTTGEPVGYIHLKDVLALDDEETASGVHAGAIPGKRIRQLAVLADSTDLEDALAQLQRSGIHLARVVDAQGTTTGVLFLEDIIEELVGEVQDATRRD